MIDISEYQHRVYLQEELPALRRLIKNKAQKYGSISALISVMNDRLIEKGWPVFSSNEISGLRREREQSRDGWSDKLIYRLGVGLGLDEDPRWGYLFLKLLFLGFWDGQDDGFIDHIKLIVQGKPLDPERLTLTKIQASLPDLSKKNLIELIRQAANQLENDATHGPLNLAAFVDALCEDYPAKIDELFSSSSLNVQRLKEIRSGEKPTPQEIRSVSLWASSTTDQTAHDIESLLIEDLTP